MLSLVPVKESRWNCCCCSLVLLTTCCSCTEIARDTSPQVTTINRYITLVANIVIWDEFSWVMLLFVITNNCVLSNVRSSYYQLLLSVFRHRTDVVVNHVRVCRSHWPDTNDDTVCLLVDNSSIAEASKYSRKKAIISTRIERDLLNQPDFELSNLECSHAQTAQNWLVLPPCLLSRLTSKDSRAIKFVYLSILLTFNFAPWRFTVTWGRDISREVC